MNSLPEEILAEIFGLLDIKSILTVSSVCKRFSDVVNAQRFMRCVSVNLTNWKLFSGSNRRYVKAYISSPDEEAIFNMVRTFTSNSAPIRSLKSIRFTNVITGDSHSFLSLASVFFNVTELLLEGVYIQNLPQVNIKFGDGFRNLKNLSFIYSTNQLLSLFTNIKNQLKSIKICLPPHDDEDDKLRNFMNVSCILDNNSGTITKLNIYDTSFNDEFMAQIANINFSNLKTFSMAFNSSLSDECRSFESFLVKNYDKLEKFKIRTFDHIGNEQLKILLENGNNLKKLNLIVCATCDYDRVAFISNLRNLETLKIQSNIYCAYGSQSYERLILDKVLGFCNPRIKCFRVELLNVNLDVMTKVINAFPNLKELNIITACIVKDDCLDLLKSKLKLLKTLKVNNKLK